MGTHACCYLAVAFPFAWGAAVAMLGETAEAGFASASGVAGVVEAAEVPVADVCVDVAAAAGAA